MPTKARKPCAYPLCPALVDKGNKYCVKHKGSDPKDTRGYRPQYKWGWPSLRSLYLKHNPLCVKCKADGIIEPATEVHHKLPVATYPGLRLDWDNLQSLCSTCHKRETAREIASGLVGEDRKR